MLMLSFDGSGRDLSVSIVSARFRSQWQEGASGFEDFQVLASERLDFDGQERSDRQGTVSCLIPTIDRLMTELSLKREQLQSICVGLGPGGFTGVRVVVVTARTLAQILAIPLIGINSLESACYELAYACGAGVVGIVKEASRSHCYAAVYTVLPYAEGYFDLQVMEGSANLPPSYLTYEAARELFTSCRFENAVIALEPAVLARLAPCPEGLLEAQPVKNMALTQSKLALLRLSLSSAQAHPYLKVEPLYLRGASITLKKGDGVERVESH